MFFVVFVCILFVFLNNNVSSSLELGFSELNIHHVSRRGLADSLMQGDVKRQQEKVVDFLAQRPLKMPRVQSNISFSVEA